MIVRLNRQFFHCRLLAASLATAVLLICSGCTGEKPASMLESAKQHIAKRDYKVAIIQTKNALQKMPDSAEARFLLGKALFESGEVAAAVVELRRASDARYPTDEVTPLLMRALIAVNQSAKAIELARLSPAVSVGAKADVMAMTALAQLVAGDTTAALTAADEALRMKPGHVPALMARARIKAFGGDVTTALAALDQSLAVDPANPDALKLKGDFLLAIDRLEDGTASYRKAIEARPDLPGLRAPYAFALLTQARFDPASPKFGEAEKEVEFLRKAVPDYYYTLMLRARVAFAKRDFATAKEAVSRLLNFYPDSAPALQVAGAVEYNLNSLGQAESHLLKALQGEPQSLNTRRLLILTYLNSGQHAKALNILEPIVAKISADADMLQLAGNVYLQAGDPRKAEESLLKAAKLQPDSGKRTALALVRLAKGENEAVYAELEQIAASDKSVTADMALIASLLHRSRLDKALDAIDKLEKKMPNSMLTFNLRGRVYLAKLDVVAARKNFERALQINPGFYSASSALAAMDQADGKPEAAVKRFEAVVAADPKNVAAYVALAKVKMLVRAPLDDISAELQKAIAADPADASARVALVDMYMTHKDPKRAVAAGQEALAALPGRAEILTALGTAQQAAGELDQALATFGKLAASQPNSVIAHLQMAEIHARNRDFDTAMRSLRKAIEVNPGHVMTYKGLVKLQLALGRDKDARATARELQKALPNDPAGSVLLGDVELAVKAWSAAADAFRSALNFEPNRDLAIKLHASLVLAGDKAGAERVSSRWLTDHPRDAAFLGYLGEDALVKGDWREAGKQFRASLLLQPDNPLLLNNMAIVAGKLKQADAIALAEKANKVAPGQAQFMDTLAMLLAESGDTARALDLLAKAANALPPDPTIRLNYARVLVQAGKKPEARKELEALAKLGDKYVSQAEVAKLLAEL